MKIQYTQKKSGSFTIPCKYYLPEEDGGISGIVLAVHGFAGSKESSGILGMAREVTARGNAVLAFDLPAHGENPAPPEDLTVGNCIEEVLFMAAQCRREFPAVPRCIFATSFGGFVTLLCSEKLADFKIVLRAPAVTMPSIFLPLTGMTKDELRAAGYANCGAYSPMLAPYSFFEDLQGYDVFADADGRPYGYAPMLVVQGDADEVVPHADVRRFCSAYPQMELHPIPGCDHGFTDPSHLQAAVRLAADWWGV